jgi:hypothetical protein
MVLSIIFLEDKHNFLLHLVIFIPLFDSGILLIIDSNKKKGEKRGG